ncbi:protein FAR1-RELATED SEQUENCE 5-like [Silene latifolia]|uniref:protein FAR1-RELATED SEQUENCE 5-like n=1 Tax=Silene latifolia TaxID=37657 RepID=UPI003D77048C
MSSNQVQSNTNNPATQIKSVSNLTAHNLHQISSTPTIQTPFTTPTQTTNTRTPPSFPRPFSLLFHPNSTHQTLISHQMDNQLLNFDIEIDHANQNDAVLHDTTATTSFSGGGGGELEPYEGMEFESEESAKSFYNSYARRVGFSTRVSSSRRSRKNGAIIQRSFVCAKEGFRNLNEKRTKHREIKRPRVITRVGCKAMLSVKINDESCKWIVNGFIKEHNHELVLPDQVHCLRSHRQISGAAKSLIDTLQAAGLGPRRIMSALIEECGGVSKVGFTEVDCRNYMRNNRNKNVEGDFELVFDYLKRMKEECCDFYCKVQGEDDEGDDGGCFTRNVFWADANARLNYSNFGDSVSFDTAFRSNRYKLPFVPVTGVNHHGQPVLFGCAFLANESESSFVWLFRTFLEAMSGRTPPVSVTTDFDDSIRSAVMQVFPETRHRFCKWHMFKKCQEKLSHVLVQYPCFEADFHKCVNLAESIDEFESCWLSFLDRYDLRGDEWLQSVYAARRQLVPVYLRDAFFAEMSITQSGDSMNSYFDGFVNASTSLNQFFKLYEKALESRNEKEVKADFETMNTPAVLRTPSPMEKQASVLYTKKIFARFQEELVGTLTFMATKVEENGEVIAYQVTKYGEDHRSFYVRFNVLEMRASCSCQMFEFSGILCRHILAVFRVTNILTLPSHYILKRWTRNAKSSVILDDQSRGVAHSYLESHIVRFSKLRHEALKFVDEGAATLETYDVAMAALQEASEKVSHALKLGGRTSLINRCPENSATDEGSQNTVREDNCVNPSEQVSEDLMDKKIRELNKELELGNRKCEVYRANLLSMLNNIEDQNQLVAVKVHNVKLSLKDAT